ncbi:MAG TPA: arginine--tRNA ligase, partial [Thermomicrobiales bacterium]|nr:arginine--tRNA ligase [Thermomicrobiales bacterium]
MSTPSNAPSPASTGGIIVREQSAAADAIRAALTNLGIEIGNRPLDMRPLPFEGTWGSASTIARMVAGDLVTAELEAAGKLEGLSKKEAKKLVNAGVNERAQNLASAIADRLRESGRFATVEAVNGYINLSYNAPVMTTDLVREVITRNATYGHAEPDSRAQKVMIEHSQLNTHKAAHVGHLRNICLGVAVTNISQAGGFTTIPVTYIGDIGRHVIRCLWCYDAFHEGEEPENASSRGRWLGQIYAEAVNRLNFRKDALACLNGLIKSDDILVEAIDKMLKLLWRERVEGEDVAYLLGRFTSREDIDLAELIDANIMVPFWPLIGDQLRAEIEQEPGSGAELALETWERYAAHMADWWPRVPEWLEQE